MGLEVIEDKQVEEEKEDLKVAGIFKEAKDKHHGILTGMYTM